jgi:hypothetical protein
MRLKAIICEVLAREVYHCAARTTNVVDVELVEKGLHSEPDKLRAVLQEIISAADPDRYDAVVLGYGLCGNATAGLQAGQVPLVMPRAHDCITLYLGSRERYETCFTAKPGTYYYTPDYIERGGSASLVPLGVTDDGDDVRETYDAYVAKYGQDNADYLMEVMGAWKAHYDQATYIDIEGIALPDYRSQVQDQAGRRGWSYGELVGRLELIQDLINGAWDAERFLKIPPGERVMATYGRDIVRAQAAQDAEEAA